MWGNGPETWYPLPSLIVKGRATKDAAEMVHVDSKHCVPIRPSAAPVVTRRKRVASYRHDADDVRLTTGRGVTGIVSVTGLERRDTAEPDWRFGLNASFPTADGRIAEA